MASPSHDAGYSNFAFFSSFLEGRLVHRIGENHLLGGEARLARLAEKQSVHDFAFQQDALATVRIEAEMVFALLEESLEILVECVPEVFQTDLG